MKLVRAEVYVEIEEKANDDSEEVKADAEWNLMWDLQKRLKDLPNIRKIRLPDSPEPDITGHIEMSQEYNWCKTCRGFKKE